MNYLISGQSGFIGNAITKYLESKGCVVFNIPRNYSIEELVEYFNDKNPDCIIHLATYGNHYNSQKDYKQMIDTNIIGTYNLLEAARIINCKSFYNFTASVVCGDFFYTTKYCAEILASKYGAVNIRPYSVYGPGEAKHKLIPTVINHLVTGEQMEVDCSATHAWIFIKDLVEAIFKGETELGDGIKRTNKEIIEILETISGKTLNYIDKRYHNYDNNNWVAPKGVCYTNLYDGLKETYEYYS